MHATVRSEVIALEVVEPALAAAAPALPLESAAVRVRPGDRYTRAADYSHGRLAAPADQLPYPFEIDLFIPQDGQQLEDWADGTFIAISEVLRNYRALLAHAPNL